MSLEDTANIVYSLQKGKHYMTQLVCGTQNSQMHRTEGRMMAGLKRRGKREIISE